MPLLGTVPSIQSLTSCVTSMLLKVFASLGASATPATSALPAKVGALDAVKPLSVHSPAPAPSTRTTSNEPGARTRPTPMVSVARDTAFEVAPGDSVERSKSMYGVSTRSGAERRRSDFLRPKLPFDASVLVCVSATRVAVSAAAMTGSNSNAPVNRAADLVEYFMLLTPRKRENDGCLYCGTSASVNSSSSLRCREFFTSARARLCRLCGEP